MAKKKKATRKKDELSPIYQNALDSLRIGMEFFPKDDGSETAQSAKRLGGRAPPALNRTPSFKVRPFFTVL
jgi:hypothetical protein